MSLGELAYLTFVVPVFMPLLMAGLMLCFIAASILSGGKL
jgi:hypothetical protein